VAVGLAVVASVATGSASSANRSPTIVALLAARYPAAFDGVRTDVDRVGGRRAVDIGSVVTFGGWGVSDEVMFRSKG
jgi:hypothetical protein